MLEVAESTAWVQYQRVDKSEIFTMLHAMQVGTCILTSGKLFVVNLDNDWLKVVVLVLHLNFVASWSWHSASEVAHIVN